MDSNIYEQIDTIFRETRCHICGHTLQWRDVGYLGIIILDVTCKYCEEIKELITTA